MKAGQPRQHVVCPLCGGTKHMRAPTAIYGHPVCRNCSHGFAALRILAYALDCAILWFAYDAGLAMLTGGSPESATASLTRAMVGFVLLAFLFKDSFSGYSPGKFIFGVRVVDETTGKPGGAIMSLNRNLILAIPFMPLVVALRLYQGHRTGDGWAHSKVIWNKYKDHAVFAPTQQEEPAFAHTARLVQYPVNDMTILRWTLVLPVAILAVILVAFPIHWVVMCICGGWGYNPVLQLGRSTLRDIEHFLQLLLSPFVFVYIGTLMAPSRRGVVSILLAVVGVIGPAYAALARIGWVNSRLVECYHDIGPVNCMFLMTVAGLIGAILASGPALNERRSHYAK